MTRAPRSARRRVQYGPASTRVKSRTVMPARSGPISRSAPGSPGRSERWGVWGAMSGPPISRDERDVVVLADPLEYEEDRGRRAGVRDQVRAPGTDRVRFAWRQR